MRDFGWVMVAVMLCGCGDLAEGLPEPTATAIGTAVGPPVTAMIGPAGGTLKTADSRLSVKIPAGALSTATAITIQPITNTSHGARGLAYELLPEGQTFSTPVEISLSYSDDDLAASGAEFLSWAVQSADGLWEVQDSTLDTTARTLTVATTHFSRWSPGIDLEIFPSISTARTGTKRRFEVHMCSLRPLGRDATGRSRFRFACSKASFSFASRTLGPWMVDGVPGGNSTVGRVTGPELVDYTAPDEVPTPDTVAVTTNVTGLDGAPSAPLRVKVRIVPAGTTYGGRYEFNHRYGSDMTITGAVDFVWTPTRVDGDVVTYTATTGYVNAHFEVADCDPVDQLLTIEDSEFVLYTAANVAFPRQYHFVASTAPMVNLLCGMPRMTVTRAIGVTITGGLCGDPPPPPFATFTDESKLRGSETCDLNTSSWSFDALD